jgi:hypothetical protein
LLITITLLASLSACGDIQKLIEDKLNEAVGEVADKVNDAGTSARDREIEKHNAYIDLYNCLISDIDEVVYDYGDEFGYEEEIIIPDNFSGFTMYSNRIIYNLDAALPYADKEPSEPKADAALKDMESSLREYAKILTDAKTYYEEKGYVDDNYAKAPEFHTIIIGHYGEIWDNVDVFLNAVDTMLEGQDEIELAEYKESGQMVRYWCLKTLVDAQAMTAYLNENVIWDNNAFDTNYDEFRALYDAFVASYNEYNSIVGEGDDAGEAEGIVNTSSYTDQLKEVKSCAAGYVEHLQNGEEYSDSELIIANDTPEGLRSEVSRLLSDYNNWIV